MTAGSAVTVSSAASITVTAPAHAAGAFTYTAPAPTIRSVSPTSGAHNGGTTVTISGKPVKNLKLSLSHGRDHQLLARADDGRQTYVDREFAAVATATGQLQAFSHRTTAGLRIEG